jgi:hypothetical protein
VTRGRRVSVGAVLGATLALVLVSAFFAAYNSTATTSTGSSHATD